MQDEKQNRKLEALQKKIQNNRQELEKTKNFYSESKKNLGKTLREIGQLQKDAGLQQVDFSEEIKKKENSSETLFNAIQHKRLELIESLNVPDDVKSIMKEHYGLNREERRSYQHLKKTEKAPIRVAGRSARKGWLPMH